MNVLRTPQPPHTTRSSPSTLFVLSPATELIVAVDGDGPGQIELHAGGQGAWVGRMSARLGCDVELCGPASMAANGVWIVDQRQDDGERDLVQTGPPMIDRHAWDDLHNLCVVRGIRAGTVVITGSRAATAPVVLFTRLCRDLASNGVHVVADSPARSCTPPSTGRSRPSRSATPS